MYRRNSLVESTFRNPSELSLMLVHAIFLFHFSPLTFLLDFYPSFSRAFSPTSIRTSRGPSMRFFRVFLFETSLYVFLLESSWLSADLSRFLGYLHSQCYDASTSFLSSMLLFRDSNYKPRPSSRPISLDLFESNRSTQFTTNSQLTTFLNLFSFKNNLISPFFLIKE